MIPATWPAASELAVDSSRAIGASQLPAFMLHPLYRVAQVASVAASTYHGYKRNKSVGWAIVWGLLGGIAPVITPAVAVAQGFGKPRGRK